jgi:hypothetical protein
MVASIRPPKSSPTWTSVDDGEMTWSIGYVHGVGLLFNTLFVLRYPLLFFGTLAPDPLCHSEALSRRPHRSQWGHKTRPWDGLILIELPSFGEELDTEKLLRDLPSQSLSLSLSLYTY